jgi:hypothetical protein
MEDNTAAKPERRGGARNTGKSWSWGALKRDVKIASEEHLIFRYLVDNRLYSAEELAVICEATVREIKLGVYGRAKRTQKRLIMLIAEHMGESWDALLQMAQKWYAGDDPGDIPAKVESLGLSPKRVYNFRKRWLQKHRWDEKKLKPIKQTTDFLLPDGIASGDLLLVNTDDKSFQAGSFYAAVIAGETRTTMGAVRGRQRLLVIESSGRKFLPVDFEEIDQEGGIIGRIVWRGGLLP